MPGITVNIYENLANGDAELSIDLTPYITAFKNREKNPEAEKTYQRLRQELQTELGHTQAKKHWAEIVNICTPTPDFSEEQRAAIKASPAIKILEKGFAEILMNSVDETIQAHHDNNSRPTVMELAVGIHDPMNQDLISVYAIDNGRGFPPEFLTEVEEGPENRDAYITQSQHEQAEPYDGPALVGGYDGPGLRAFIADAQNDELINLSSEKHLKPVYAATPQSSLRFSNPEDDEGNTIGALITLTTPLAPRKTLAKAKEEAIQRSKSMKAQVQALPPEKDRASPTGSNATTDSELTDDDLPIHEHNKK